MFPLKFSGWIIAKYHLEAIRQGQASSMAQNPKGPTGAATEAPDQTLVQPRSTRVWLLPWLVPPDQLRSAKSARQGDPR